MCASAPSSAQARRRRQSRSHSRYTIPSGRAFTLQVQPSAMRSFYARTGRNTRMALGKVGELTPEEARKCYQEQVAREATSACARRRLGTYRLWTLPPTLTVGQKDRAKYLAMGESDRMTLKFVKPRRLASRSQ